MALIAIMSFFFLALTALAVFFILGVPFLIWLGKVLCVLVGGFFEWAASAFEKTRTEAAIERKVEAGMTSDEAREAVEREREERAHQETSLAHIALVSAAFLLVIALVGVADYLFGPRLEPSSTVGTSTVEHEGPYLYETREGGLYDRERGYALPHVGTHVEDIEDTYYMGEYTSCEHCDVYYDFVYVWEAKNGTHDPVLKAYVKDGVVLNVEYCNEAVYWRDESGLPDLYAEPLWRREADESSGEAEQGATSSTGDSTAATETSKAPVDTYEGNPSASFDPLDYDSAEEYAEDAEGWFRDHGSVDPYGDALEYWEDNGP